MCEIILRFQFGVSFNNGNEARLKDYCHEKLGVLDSLLCSSPGQQPIAPSPAFTSVRPAPTQPTTRRPQTTKPIQTVIKPTGESLFSAATKQDCEQVKRLIQSGAPTDYQSRDNENFTFLHRLVLNDNWQCIRDSLALIPRTQRKKVIDMVTDFQRTPLYLAAFNGYINSAEILTSSGADIDKPEDGGRTPLWTASFSGHLDVASLLVTRGADLNRKASQVALGFAPLHAAVQEGYLGIVTELVENGADVNLESGFHKETPLSRAASNGRPEIADYLLEKGANTEIVDRNGKTPLYFAAFYGHPDIATSLLNRGAQVNRASVDLRYSPLHVAALADHLDVIKVLLGWRALANMVDRSGQTPIFKAIKNGNFDVVEQLIGARANLIIRDKLRRQ